MYFTDYFAIDKKLLEDYGAFDLSLINDLPLFIDPFLLFNSENEEYQRLHQDIINYLIFLRNESATHNIDKGLLKSWFCFKEIKQNWLGFSKVGNTGSGLGMDFAYALNENLGKIFTNFGDEKIANGSHLEKLCLIHPGVGRDNISDFTTNLIKDYLLKYTSQFATENINPSMLSEFYIPRALFSYKTKSWVTRSYILPRHNNDYVILTPKDILTKDETWICRPDMLNDFRMITDALPNDALRAQLNDYLRSILPKYPNRNDYLEAVSRTIKANPEFIEYYIKYKEENGNEAVAVSEAHVKYTEFFFIENIKSFVGWLNQNTNFYKQAYDTYKESLDRINFLKHVIENNDGYKIFYLNGKPVHSEKELQLLFRLTWFETPSDVNSEVNNGRGPVDYKISRGSKDKTVIEFKLASNSQLEKNLKKQAEIYAKANDTKKIIKAIMYFTLEEELKLKEILERLKILDKEYVITIDARNDNKTSASRA